MTYRRLINPEDNPTNDPDFFYPDEVPCIKCGELLGYENVTDYKSRLCCYCNPAYTPIETKHDYEEEE